eukprot:230459-Pleurochrysis_carterae.AAC.1
MECLPSTLQNTDYCPRHQGRQRMHGTPSSRAGCKLLRAERLPLYKAALRTSADEKKRLSGEVSKLMRVCLKYGASDQKPDLPNP